MALFLQCSGGRWNKYNSIQNRATVSMCLLSSSHETEQRNKGFSGVRENAQF